MARRKKYTPTLRPISGDNRKKFEALLTQDKPDKISTKYARLSSSRVYVKDEDMRW